MLHTTAKIETIRNNYTQQIQGYQLISAVFYVHLLIYRQTLNMQNTSN